jgi:hypothetical protein
LEKILVTSLTKVVSSELGPLQEVEEAGAEVTKNTHQRMKLKK